MLRDLGANAVFSNVGYLPLAGAQRAGIANAALCSLNWFDIYRHYAGDDAVAAQIHACYADADAFLRATPGMEMETLPNLVEIAPIAALGHDRRDELVWKPGTSPSPTTCKKTHSLGYAHTTVTVWKGWHRACQ